MATDTKTLIKPYLGKRWKTKASAAEIFSHEEAELPVRFYEAGVLREHLTSSYYDEMVDCLKCADNDGEWTDAHLVPFAAIGYEGAGEDQEDEGDDGEEEEEEDPFLSEAFAYLFHDTKHGTIVYATTDDWTRDNTIPDLARLGLKPA